MIQTLSGYVDEVHRSDKKISETMDTMLESLEADEVQAMI